jgi:hypothetical protein
MDVSQFRGISSGAAADNFRNCLGHWAAAMREAGRHHDLGQHIHYVTALCYPLVSNPKSMQGVYRDAFLARGRTDPTADGLPDAVRRRIRKVVRSRDRALLQQELDRTLGWSRPPAEIMPAMREAFRRWVGAGVALMRRHGNDGLEAFLEAVDYWLARYRKKGGGEHVRRFIDLFSCEAKVSFYTCYANAWIDLIPWLREHRGLDPASERFLRFWHNQNQPVEVPHGRTPGGVCYPTQVWYDLPADGPGGGGPPRRLQFPTERIGPTHLPDVFRGHVLSLHPLSGSFMRDAALCEAAGRVFGSDGYDQIMVGGRGEYWDLMGAIVTAANQYRRAADAQANERGVRIRGGAAVEHVAGGPGDVPEGLTLEDFAASRRLSCPKCRKPVRLVQYHPAGDADEFRVDFACRGCDRPVEGIFSRSAFQQWLIPTE